VCKLSIQVQRHVWTALGTIIFTLILTQRSILEILLIVPQRIVLGTQRIVLGILIAIIVTVAVLITVSILNIGLGIITIIGSTAPGTSTIVKGTLGIITT
jgi:hypothetical protein